MPQLVAHFAERYSREFQKPTVRFAPEALAALAAREWPGNIRELQNEVQRLVICAVNPVVGLDELNEDRILLDGDADPEATTRTLEESVAEFEKGLLAEALRIHGGNQTHTAKALGLSRPGLFKKLRRYGMSAREE